MLKKEISYVDYDGNPRVEVAYFNLSKAELIDMEFMTKGGIVNKLEKLAKDENPKNLLVFFKDLLAKAYGVKSEDGRRFIKSKEAFVEFSQTEAYSVLLTELLSNEESMSAFINGIIPKLD